MAKDQSRRVSPSILEADRTSFAALQAITAYTPVNQNFSLARLAAVHNELADAQRLETQTAAAAAAARDDAISKEWEFHNLLLGAKDQVVAQFGRDSNEVQSIGFKKASEYKSRRRANKSGQE
jgi:hypothetical protein